MTESELSARFAKVKNRLTRSLGREIQRRRMSRTKAAKLFGITVYETDLLRNGLGARFTFDELFRFLKALGFEITLVLTNRKHRAERTEIRL